MVGLELYVRHSLLLMLEADLKCQVCNHDVEVAASVLGLCLLSVSVFARLWVSITLAFPILAHSANALLLRC